MAKCREQTIFYSNISLARVAKHAACDKMEQAPISRCPNVKRPAAVQRNLPDGNRFVQLQLQAQCGLTLRLLAPVGALHIGSCRLAALGNKTPDRTSYSLPRSRSQRYQRENASNAALRGHNSHVAPISG